MQQNLRSHFDHTKLHAPTPPFSVTPRVSHIQQYPWFWPFKYLKEHYYIAPILKY